jgi:hypothetical protein
MMGLNNFFYYAANFYKYLKRNGNNKAYDVMTYVVYYFLHATTFKLAVPRLFPLENHFTTRCLLERKNSSEFKTENCVSK